MGSCQGSEEINAIPVRVRKRSKSKSQSLYLGIKYYLEYKDQKEEFPDMPEWTGNRFSGIGIKRMQGYKCNLPIDKLNEQRKAFWRTRSSNYDHFSHLWRIINQACVYDEYRANSLLEEYKLTAAEGCINHLIDPDDNHYFIPNYCINDPYFEKDLNVKESVDEKQIQLKLYEVTENLTIDITISNMATGEDLKKEFRKKSKISRRDYCFRLFFGGNEIKNEHQLFQHKLNDGYKIQVMKVEKAERRKSRKISKRLNKVKSNTNDTDSN